MTISTMSLNEYLQYNFFKYKAYLPNGGLIVAAHGRDKSTEKYYAQQGQNQFLVSYLLDGVQHHCQNVDACDVTLFTL